MRSFNSTMVRLKDELLASSLEDIQNRFNSTMVRLKDDIRLPEDLGFNSTMVRLKARTGNSSTSTRLVKFQFHNGSIKRFSFAHIF